MERKETERTEKERKISGIKDGVVVVMGIVVVEMVVEIMPVKKTVVA